MSGRTVLIIDEPNKPHNGLRLVALFGNTVRVVNNESGEISEYWLTRLRGSTVDFWFGVPIEHRLNGDWLIERLARSYLA